MVIPKLQKVLKDYGNIEVGFFRSRMQKPDLNIFVSQNLISLAFSTDSDLKHSTSKTCDKKSKKIKCTLICGTEYITILWKSISDHNIL